MVSRRGSQIMVEDAAYQITPRVRLKTLVVFQTVLVWFYESIQCSTSYILVWYLSGFFEMRDNTLNFCIQLYFGLYKLSHKSQ